MYGRYAPPPRLDLDYVVGVDLGQAQDYTGYGNESFVHQPLVA